MATSRLNHCHEPKNTEAHANFLHEFKVVGDPESGLAILEAGLVIGSHAACAGHGHKFSIKPS